MKVDLTEIKLMCDEEGDCWIWRGPTRQGKACMFVKGDKRFVRKPVRRAVWELTRETPVPKSMGIVARCGNVLCVSPDHATMTNAKGRGKYYAATGSYTSKARVLKATIKRRENSPYPQELIEQIRVSKEPAKEVSEKFGISRCYVNQIRRELVRKDLTNPFVGLFSGLLR